MMSEEVLRALATMIRAVESLPDPQFKFLNDLAIAREILAKKHRKK
jgi:hypothetical protein